MHGVGVNVDETFTSIGIELLESWLSIYFLYSLDLIFMKWEIHFMLILDIHL